jgi:hypothetical protein
MIRTDVQTVTVEPAIRLTGSDRKDVGKEIDMAEWPTVDDCRCTEKDTDEHTDRLEGTFLQDEQIYR